MSYRPTLSPHHHFILQQAKNSIEASFNRYILSTFSTINLNYFNNINTTGKSSSSSNTNNSNRQALSFLDLKVPLTRRALSPCRPPTVAYTPSASDLSFNNDHFIQGYSLKNKQQPQTEKRGSNATSAWASFFSFGHKKSSTATSAATTIANNMSTTASEKSHTARSSAASGLAMEQDPNVPAPATNVDIENKPAAQPKTEAYVPPDGGLKAWLAVLAGWLCQFCSFGFINALGIFQLEYQNNILKGTQPNTITWILTFQLFLMFFLSQVVGIAVDMVGPRKVLIPSSVLAVLGLCMLSLCTEYYQIFLAQSVCFGIGAAGIFMPGLVTAGQYFKNRRALALGIVASGSSVGGVIFPIMLSRLFQKVGFAAGIRWTALMIGIMLVIANVLADAPLKPKGWGSRSLSGLQAFKRLEFVIYVVGAFLFFWGLFCPFNFLPVFTLDVSPTLAAYTVSIINAGSIPGRILPNQIADKIGAFPMMFTTAIISAITILAIWLPINFHATAAGVIVFALVYGFFSGAFVSLMTPCMISLCDGKMEDLGVMLGAFMVVVAFASLTGLPIESTIAEKAEHSARPFTGLIGFSGATMLVGSLLIGVTWFMRWKRGADKRPAAH